MQILIVYFQSIFNPHMAQTFFPYKPLLPSSMALRLLLAAGISPLLGKTFPATDSDSWPSHLRHVQICFAKHTDRPGQHGACKA